jgi:vacuole morphology and inheritance protein 14
MNIIKPEFFQQRSKQNSEQKSPISFDKIIKPYLESPSMEENNINLIFDWASQLYKSKLFNDDDFLINLIFYIPKINEIIIKRILELLNGICSNKNNENINFNFIIKMIIKKFNENPEMISTYGILIIKELIKSINIEVLFEELSNELLECDDIYFVMRMLNMLNKFLITEEDASSIRIKLSKFGNEGEEVSYFTKIFKLWSYNPFCTLILVLISNSFELAYFLINYLSQMKLRAEDYIELSQVVQVFESSIFNHVRIKLLNPKKYSYLIKTLYAILLLLPQGQAFNSLSSRLKCLQIIYNLGEDDDDESSKCEKINFSEDSSNSLYSNVKNSNCSLNGENNLYETKEGEISKKNNYIDKVEYEVLIKKGLKTYINIFEEIQEKREEFESNVYSQKKSSCCSPPYKNK